LDKKASKSILARDLGRSFASIVGAVNSLAEAGIIEKVPKKGWEKVKAGREEQLYQIKDRQWYEKISPSIFTDEFENYYEKLVRLYLQYRSLSNDINKCMAAGNIIPSDAPAIENFLLVIIDMTIDNFVGEIDNKNPKMEKWFFGIRNRFMSTALKELSNLNLSPYISSKSKKKEWNLFRKSLLEKASDLVKDQR